jgi:chemotaxis family two-component system sensor kinase Cph1
VHRHVILWFRSSVVQTITWAGRPYKETRADGRIQPRSSFASWKEELRERSLPWTSAERAAALELRQSLIGIVLRRAEELAGVATELGRVNKELEAFSYTVSHDLRAPMRHISGYIDLVLEIEGATLSERARRYLAHVKDASAYSGRLVDGLLDFSRMGRSALKRTRVDTAMLAAELVREFARQDAGHAIEWSVAPDLPVLDADPLLIQLALRNLIANAVKYSREREPAHIRIEARRDAHGEGLAVVDDGVGFDMKYVGKLFGVFQRLHQSDEFEGTGIGLASVRRIVERHGGRVHAEGALGRGATFGFTLPRQEEKENT